MLGMIATRTATAVVAFGIVTASAQAQFLPGFEMDLTKEDTAMLKQTIKNLLQGPTDTNMSTWSNAKTQHSGTTQRIRKFKKNDLQCFDIQSTIISKGEARKFVTPFCKVADGTWKIAH
jgi:surface antigen